MTQFPSIEESLERFGEDTVKFAKQNLVRTGSTTSSNSLYKSIDYDVIVRAGGIEINLFSAFYGAFKDQGVRGSGKGTWEPYKKKSQQAPKSPYKYTTKMPPIDVFKEWISNKPVSLRKIGGEEPSTATTAFLMARSAFRFGMKPSYFYTDAINKTLPILKKEIGIALTNDVQAFLEREVFKLKKSWQ